MIEAGCSAKREPVSHDVMNFIERLATQAEKTAARIDDQLHAVCLPDRPSPEKATTEEVCREFPPLFNDMRDRLTTIEYAFRRINNVLDRCEV